MKRLSRFALANWKRRRNEMPSGGVHPLAQRAEWECNGTVWHYTGEEPPMLNLGCGGHFHPAWINIDVAPADPTVLQHDLARPLPFESGVFKTVYHSHVLEHIPKHQALSFMRECRRVLAPEGIIRVAVPDLEAICRLYIGLTDRASKGDPNAADDYEWIVIELLDQMTRHVSGGEMMRYWRQDPMPAAAFVFERVGQEAASAIASLRQEEDDGAPSEPADANSEAVGRFRLSGEVHQWMYDRFSLSRLLLDAGFCDPVVKSATSSAIDGFRTFSLDEMSDGTTRKPDSLFMEAHHPPQK